MNNVTQGSKIMIADLNQVETLYGLTNTTAGTTCQQAQITALHNINNGIVVPAVGDLITAADFNIIINSLTLDFVPAGTFIYIQETTNGEYAQWYKVSNSGHYSADTVPLIRTTTVGAARFNNRNSSESDGMSYLNKYNVNGTNYVKDTLNVTWVNSLGQEFRNALIQTEVPTKENAQSVAAISNLSLYAWAPSQYEWSGGTNANWFEGTPFTSLPPAYSLFTWTRSPVGGMGGYARIINTSNNVANQPCQNNYQIRPVICLNKFTSVVPYSDGYAVEFE